MRRVEQSETILQESLVALIKSWASAAAISILNDISTRNAREYLICLFRLQTNLQISDSYQIHSRNPI